MLMDSSKIGLDFVGLAFDMCACQIVPSGILCVINKYIIGQLFCTMVKICSITWFMAVMLLVYCALTQHE